MAITENTFKKVMPHGPIEEILPDVFFVQGSISLPLGFRFSRNMVVLRQGSELTVINAVRLNDKEQTGLEALGDVAHVVRIGTMHGMDDPYYVDRYGARFWCQRGDGVYSEPSVDEWLDENNAPAVDGLKVLPFTATSQPECMLLLDRDGGLLIACDALQSWTDWGQCSWLARKAMPLMGFEPRLLIGPIWKKRLSVDNAQLKSDFERLLAQDFGHFVGAHGGYRLNDAKPAVVAAIDKAFAV